MLLCMMIMCLNSLAFFCFLSGEWPTCSQWAGGGGGRGRQHVGYVKKSINFGCSSFPQSRKLVN